MTRSAPAGVATARSPLELDGRELRELLDAVGERLGRFLDTLDAQPAAATAGGEELARRLREPLPRRGRELGPILDLLFDEAIPRAFNPASPGYLAFVPGGGLPESAVASLVAEVVNRYVGVRAAAPALVELEANVVRWLAEIVGYPAAHRGILTSGGSLAHLTALVTARRERLGDDFLRGVVYASDQTHHSFAKAAVLAGFPERNLRLLPSDASFRLRLDALAAAVEADRRAGLAPFLVAANAGTTNTGAVDPLPELVALCRARGLWLHADAAYGGFFALTARGRRLLEGLAEVDSLVLDPHKGLFLPFGTGALLVRDGEALRRAHRFHADYLPASQTDAENVDFQDLSPELTRPFRGLGVWLPMVLHGADVFAAALDEKLDLAAWASARLREHPRLELLAEPQLSTVAFAVRADATAAANDRTRELLDRVNARRRVFLTGTLLGPRFAARLCILHFRTHREQVAMALDDIAAALAEIPS
jgi:aromatic-L-amino-acid decarboxylase